MKQLLLSIFLFFCFHLALAQLPEATIDSILLELQSCDQLKLKYDKQTEQLKATRIELDERKEDIKYYKVTLEEYRGLVRKIEAEGEVDLVLEKAKNKRLKRTVVGLVLTNVGTVVLLVLIIL